MPIRNGRGLANGPSARPTLIRIILFVAIVAVTLLAGSQLGGSRFSEAPKWAVSAVALLIGAAAFAFAIAWADARLRRRGKNGFWLLLFFGPLVTGAKVLELVPSNREELQIIALLVGCILGAPFAIWGAVELSARD